MPTAFDKSYTHWQVLLDDEAILWLTCDRDGHSTNALSEALIAELGEILTDAAGRTLTGLVLRSGKPGSFILGADIHEFDQYTDAALVTERIRQGHAVFAQLENLECHTVAIVEGFCLGGGLELALSCDYIAALKVDATRLGFPEVKLGIFPGLGGTVRATERLGALPALELMLTGRLLRAAAARRLNLIDELVDPTASLDWAARRAIAKRRHQRKPGTLVRLGNLAPIRPLIATLLRRKTTAKADPRHYPAPFSMIDLWAAHRGDRQRMFDGEARRVGELMVGDTARNLRRVFFLSERMKSLGKDSDHEVRRVHVVGAGVMGGDIAAWCVLEGLEVSLQDRAMEQIEQAQSRAKTLFRKRLKTQAAVQAAMARLRPDPDGAGVAGADVVIEAIVEQAEAKRALYASLETHLKPDAILATNTSALPLAELSRDLADPARLIGLHFFNPVAKMPLVEVVHDEHTHERWITRGCAFCTTINRFALPVRSAPGFLVNRVLAPYLMLAFRILGEGTDQHSIDAAAREFGMPMGPIELADVVGLDVCMQVAETLAEGDVDTQRRMLQQKIDAGKLGKKSGEGFYTWKKGKAQREDAMLEADDRKRLAERLMQPFLSECESVSAEGLVVDDDLLDAGIIFGTGFAPFTGGPLQYLADSRSTQTPAAEAAR